jgi:Cu/Ag efflux protein CusF
MILAASLLTNSVAVLAQSATADGEVKKIDEGAGKITIRHGPIKAFDMESPMTMVYRVKDPAMLKAVKVGDKVKMDIDHETQGYTITKIQKAK